MISALLNVPSSKDEWDRWSWHHKDSHDRIRQAANTQYSVDLKEYLLDPINFERTQEWLARNTQSHNDMNAVLSLQGSDLEELDFSKPEEVKVWIWLHFLEHQSAEVKLGI